MYNTTQRTLSLPADTLTRVPTHLSMPAKNVTYEPTDAMTVTEAGDYELSYMINVFASAGTDMTFEVQQDGTEIPATVTGRTMAAGAVTPISGTTIATLPAGAVLSLAVSAPNAVDLTFIRGVNASLTVKKIN